MLSSSVSVWAFFFITNPICRLFRLDSSLGYIFSFLLLYLFILFFFLVLFILLVVQSFFASENNKLDCESQDWKGSLKTKNIRNIILNWCVRLSLSPPVWRTSSFMTYLRGRKTKTKQKSLRSRRWTENTFFFFFFYVHGGVSKNVIWLHA